MCDGLFLPTHFCFQSLCRATLLGKLTLADLHDLLYGCAWHKSSHLTFGKTANMHFPKNVKLFLWCKLIYSFNTIGFNEDRSEVSVSSILKHLKSRTSINQKCHLQWVFWQNIFYIFRRKRIEKKTIKLCTLYCAVEYQRQGGRFNLQAQVMIYVIKPLMNQHFQINTTVQIKQPRNEK